ncbi:MAG: NADH-quinone oxidoreductase subunit G [Gammaproteobacteria bacterium RIFCSPLOWO2_12_47_11]|nr:MAG: NADH-quinone oxidoreductase subunit G [Gammaproteobacteria bacterium RIFCSPLOWO2_12_47_11]
MTTDLITIEVDGKLLQARKGQMLIEVTDNNDIYVPRFCYHKKLSIAANCRMCLVDVEKAPKPLPACATPVMEGMKVKTRSQRALESQKAVMEFLLINHPLDCPICDQGGECELQDLAMGYGRDVSRYQENKRVVQDKNIGPLVQTDMTRCIHCTRCVRFGQEIAGMRELGATGRGEHMEIGTYIEKSMVSEMSGNIIDICPVGALTSKPFRFSARAWEMQQRDSIAPHDSVGSNIQIHIKQDRVKRVVPAENESINEVWLSDRDRFSYEGLYHSDRLTVPMIREGNTWSGVDWETALQFAIDGINNVIKKSGAGNIATLASPSSTLEELYLLQKIMRGLGSHNIDHRIRQGDFTDQDADPLFPWLGTGIVDLEKLDCVLLIGSNVRKEQPIINHRLRKASMRGCCLLIVNPVDYDFNFNTSAKIIVTPAGLATALTGILKALTGQGGAGVDATLMNHVNSVAITDEHRLMAGKLKDAQNGMILLGNLATAHPEFSTLRALAGAIARLANVKIGFLAESANSAGACLAGMLPHRKPGGTKSDKSGLDAGSMFSEGLKAYVLMGIEPELDCWNGLQALQALRSAGFVVSLTAYQTDMMKSYAHVLLPVGLFAETSGTYINNEGRSQSFNGVVQPAGEARPGWKILRVMGNLFNLPGFDYNTSVEIRDELQMTIADVVPSNNVNWKIPVSISSDSHGLQRIADIPMNAIDPVTRRAKSLQQTADITDGAAHINAALARQLGLQEGDKAKVEQDEQTLTLPVVIDNRIPGRCVLIHAAQPCHAQLGAWYGEIKLGKS